jgi:hypothetical protein
MKTILKCLCATVLGLTGGSVSAQTDGAARVQVTLSDYNGSSMSHYTVAWVTRENGTFIKSLRKQGPSSWSSGEWNNHCRVWNNARAGSPDLDGYSSATATSYSGTNSPVVCTWNCRDASNNLVPDGNYKFWVQYAENSGQGPHTTNGLLWVKGPTGVTNTYANIAANFSNMRVTWTPVPPPTFPPTITSVAPGAAGTVGVPYNFSCTATGTVPITFSASGLPPGLSISPAGAISGTPTAAGVFSGTITATNGTPPNANQPFSIAVNVLPASITAVRLDGNNLILSGSGPANGIYAMLTSTNADRAGGDWMPLGTNSFGDGGQFSFTNALDLNVPQQFFRLRVP